MKRRRYRTRSRRATPAAPKQPRKRAGAPEQAQPVSANQLRTVVCGAIFVALVALKLLLPGGMAEVRSTLGAWLVRDADFVSAFSAVGRAVSGEDGVLDSLENAYIAVFGGEQQEAEEVAGVVTDLAAEDTPEPQVGDARPYPEHAAAEHRVLSPDGPRERRFLPGRLRAVRFFRIAHVAGHAQPQLQALSSRRHSHVRPARYLRGCRWLPGALVRGSGIGSIERERQPDRRDRRRNGTGRGTGGAESGPAAWDGLPCYDAHLFGQDACNG